MRTTKIRICQSVLITRITRIRIYLNFRNIKITRIIPQNMQLLEFIYQNSLEFTRITEIIIF